MSNIVK